MIYSLEVFDNQYHRLKNAFSMTYEQLVMVGYTPDKGFTQEVYEKVYHPEHPMEGGYVFEPTTGEIVPIKRKWMKNIQPGRYIIESKEGVWSGLYG